MPATLSTPIILQAIATELAVSCPALNLFTHEFTTERVHKNQKVIGHIQRTPTVSSYDESTGYNNGAQEGRSLLVDVEFTMSNHNHITITGKHIADIAGDKGKLQDFIQSSASALGRHITRGVLGKIHTGNFSNASTEAAANVDRGTLRTLTGKLNRRGVPEGRVAILNSDAADGLLTDTSITDRRDGASQGAESAYMHLRGVAGFNDVVEDPGLNAVNGPEIAFTAATTDLITTASAHGLLVNQRVDISGLAGGAGLSAGKYYVKTVPSATTLTLSATRGGATADVTTAYTDGKIKLAENLIGFAGSREAIAIKTALPTDTLGFAAQLGIPVPASSEVITDPNSGLSLLSYAWFEPHTMNMNLTLTILWGVAAGAEMDTESLLMEPSGELLRAA